MKIQFIIVGWHYNQDEFYDGLNDLKNENEFIDVFWTCHKEPTQLVKDNFKYKVFENEGMTLYCDKKSYIFLLGTEIDYEESMMSSGFRFNTPQATAKCGCGESVGF